MILQLKKNGTKLSGAGPPYESNPTNIYLILNATDCNRDFGKHVGGKERF